ncbi:hypothetical protein ACTQ1R_04905 [Prevotellaceae bacterium LCP21S3_C11]
MRAFFYNILNDGGKRVSGHLSFQLLFLFFILFVSSFYTCVQGITPGKLISHKQSSSDKLQAAYPLFYTLSADSTAESAKPQAEEQDNANSDTIDFKLCFDILAKNRKAYNRYNDSIFMIKEHDKWVNYFRHRAVRNHQIYAANQEIMRGIKEFFKRHGDSIPEEVYLNFCHSMEKEYVSKNLYDPFLLVKMTNILEKGGEYLPDSVKYTNVFNFWRLYGYEQMWNLGGDVKYLRKAYQAGKAILSEDAKRYPHYDFALAGALEYMSNTIWLAFGLETMAQVRKSVDSPPDMLTKRSSSHGTCFPIKSSTFASWQRRLPNLTTRYSYATCFQKGCLTPLKLPMSMKSALVYTMRRIRKSAFFISILTNVTCAMMCGMI